MLVSNTEIVSFTMVVVVKLISEMSSKICCTIAESSRMIAVLSESTAVTPHPFLRALFRCWSRNHWRGRSIPVIVESVGDRMKVIIWESVLIIASP